MYLLTTHTHTHTHPSTLYYNRTILPHIRYIMYHNIYYLIHPRSRCIYLHPCSSVSAVFLSRRHLSGRPADYTAIFVIIICSRYKTISPPRHCDGIIMAVISSTACERVPVCRTRYDGEINNITREIFGAYMMM